MQDAKRYDLFTKACKVHNDLSKTSSSGHGIDRYFMGLKTRLRDGETHALFEDEYYGKSQEWKLSTSAFSAGKNFVGIGFGAAWVDGYGINCTFNLLSRSLSLCARGVFVGGAEPEADWCRSTWSSSDQVRDREQVFMSVDFDFEIQTSHSPGYAGHETDLRVGPPLGRVISSGNTLLSRHSPGTLFPVITAGIDLRRRSHRRPLCISCSHHASSYPPYVPLGILRNPVIQAHYM